MGEINIAMHFPFSSQASPSTAHVSSQSLSPYISTHAQDYKWTMLIRGQLQSSNLFETYWKTYCEDRKIWGAQINHALAIQLCLLEIITQTSISIDTLPTWGGTEIPQCWPPVHRSQESQGWTSLKSKCRQGKRARSFITEFNLHNLQLLTRCPLTESCRAICRFYFPCYPPVQTPLPSFVV